MVQRNGEASPLLLALMEKRVMAKIFYVDHYRVGGGLAVETDYIIRVESKGSNNPRVMPDFELFTLSKTFSAFRTFANQLKKAADGVTCSGDDLPKSVQKLAQYCETVLQLVESQRTQYLGKVGFSSFSRCTAQRAAVDLSNLTCPTHTLIGELQLRQGIGKETDPYCQRSFRGNVILLSRRG